MRAENRTRLQQQVSHGGAFDFDFGAVGAEFLLRPSGSPQGTHLEKEAAPDCPAITWRLFSPCDTMLTLSRHSAIRESASMSAAAVQFSSLSLNVKKHIENCRLVFFQHGSNRLIQQSKSLLCHVSLSVVCA